MSAPTLEEQIADVHAIACWYESLANRTQEDIHRVILASLRELAEWRRLRAAYQAALDQRAAEWANGRVSEATHILVQVRRDDLLMHERPTS